MIEEPYKNLFCNKCKNKIVIDGKDRCGIIKCFVKNNPFCSEIFKCRRFEEDENKSS